MQAGGQLIEALNQGQADPMQVMPALQAFYQHIAQHAQFASGEPALEGIVSQANQLLQYFEEAINNTAKAIEKQQRDQAEMAQAEGMQGGEQPQQDPKLAAAQVQMQIMQQKAELEMQIKQRKFEQDQAIRDAEAAMKMQEEARG